MAESRLYKTAHYNYRNTTRPYPLIPQVMNGTGALRQFVPRSLGIAPGRPLAIGQRQSLTIRDVEIFQTDEVFGKHNDHVVDAFTKDRPDQSFGGCVLPRRAWGNRLITDAHGS